MPYVPSVIEFSSDSGYYSSDRSSQHVLDLENPNVNSLESLIKTEKNYLETLKIIDSQVALIWSRQHTSVAPDFSRLLKSIHDILKANKRFCIKLTKIAANPDLKSKLKDILMHWIDDMELPYASYMHKIIPNLDKRTDIVRNESIQSLLKNLTDNVSYDIGLQVLFNSPIRQLEYYKELYMKLYKDSKPDILSHSLLSKASSRIDRILFIGKKGAHHQNTPDHSVPLIDNHQYFQTPGLDPQHDLIIFENQVDCSKAVDLYGGARINYKLKLTTPGTEMVMRDSFFLLSSDNEAFVKVHLVLTTELLVICTEKGPFSYSLLYPAIPIGDISVQSQLLDKEIVGEYVIQFTVLGERTILMRADSKEKRNTWVGVDPQAPSSTTLTPRQLGIAAHNMMLMKKQRKKNHHIFTNFSYTLNDTPGRGPATNTKINHVRITDSFATCTDNSGKPLLSRESSDTMAYKKDSKKDEKSCETVLGLYGEHTSNYYSIEKYEPFTSNKQSRKHVMNVAPQSINSLPHAPNRSQNAASSDRSIPTLALPSQQVTPVNGPVKVLSHVGITYIEPLTAHLKKMSTSPPLENENISIKSRQANPSLSTPYHFSNTMAQSMNKKYHAVPAPLDRYAGNGMKSNDSKPSSPRPVELQKAIIPEAMQAVTQKTDDYLLSASPDSRKIQTSSSSNRSRSPAPQHAMPRTSSVRNMPPMGHQQHLHPSQHQRPNNNQQGRPTSPQPHYRSNPSSPQMPRSNGHTAPYPNQQYPGGKVQPPNYNKPMPSPTLSPSTSSNTARRPPHSPRMQQSPTQYYPSSSSGHLNSPPQSPNQFSSQGIQKVLFSNDRCDVFHWNNQSWYAAEGHCLLQINVAQSNRTCVAVQLQESGQLYLNAWILPNTVIRQASATDINISLYIGTKKENYLIHFNNASDASVFFDILTKVHQDAINSPPVLPEKQPELEADMDDANNVVNVPQTLKPLMQCKCKLFLQNETGNWSTFGGVSMRISEQTPSMRMHIEIENDKGKLVSATVKSGNVEKLNSKRITFLLVNEADRKSMVYMVHLREEQTGNKIFEYLRIKNSENGW